MPMQPPQRRHDGSYAPMPPHMRQPGYPPYYPQHMGPMMPQYPQQYAPNWYPYQQQQMHPMHQPRHHYYPQQPMPPPQYHPMPMASQPMPQHPSPRPVHTPGHAPQLPPPSSASTTSTAPVQTPPSPPLSTSTTTSTRKDLPSQSSSPAPQRVRSPSTEAVPESERFFPPVSPCMFSPSCTLTSQTPWLSLEGEAFPPRAPRQKRRIPRSQLANEPIVYPLPEPAPASAPAPDQPAEVAPDQSTPKAENDREQKATDPQAEDIPPSTPTPLASDAPSEDVSTQPTTPASSAAATSAKSQQTPTQTRTRPAGQVMPVLPALPHSPTAARKTHRDSVVSTQSRFSEDASKEEPSGLLTSTDGQEPEKANGETDGAPAPAPAAPKPKPSSWASLLRPAQSSSAAVASADFDSSLNGGPMARGEALSDVLHDMNAVDAPSKISFLQPRGLVNTGNMCYMNSVSVFRDQDDDETDEYRCCKYLLF